MIGNIVKITYNGDMGTPITTVDIEIEEHVINAIRSIGCFDEPWFRRSV